MRTIHLPLDIVGRLVEQAEALDLILKHFASGHVPAVAAEITALRGSLQAVGTLYHHVVDEDEQEAPDGDLRGRTTTRSRGAAERAARHR